MFTRKLTVRMIQRFIFFFFQAEDGIRDYKVTGVQTCAIPILRRTGLSEAEVRAILAAQATREQRLARADDVIDNSGTPGALERQVSHLNEKYLDRKSVV